MKPVHRKPAHKGYDTATDSSSGLIRRLVVAWLGVVLLVFNLAASGGSLLGPADTAQTPFPTSVDISATHVTICTTAGMVEIDGDGKPLPSPSHGGICVFCLPLMHSGAIAAVAEISVRHPSAFDTDVALPDDYGLPVLRQALNPHSARAPPALT